MKDCFVNKRIIRSKNTFGYFAAGWNYMCQYVFNNLLTASTQ